PVRGVATFVKSATDGIDSLLSNLAKSGVLDKTTTVQISEGGYKLKLNTAFNTSVTSTAFPSGKTYKNSFEVWKASNDSKIMELFFDSSTSKSEVLAIWQPNLIDTTLST